MFDNHFRSKNPLHALSIFHLNRILMLMIKIDIKHFFIHLWKIRADGYSTFKKFEEKFEDEYYKILAKNVYKSNMSVVI